MTQKIFAIENENFFANRILGRFIRCFIAVDMHLNEIDAGNDTAIETKELKIHSIRPILLFFSPRHLYNEDIDADTNTKPITSGNRKSLAKMESIRDASAVI